MLSARATRLLAAATLTLGATLTLSPSQAFAAAEGNYSIGSGSCQAVEKIELHWVNGAYHDEMANNPTQNSASDPYWCRFTMYDNGNLIWSSAPATGTGAQSPWFYDGPGHYMKACVQRYYNGTPQGSASCGPLN
ncbi:hypothetical protein F4556_006229 [Kitasatospora gansuensis]|uniref:Secreted protein n=1 Tax=Kitasatospora gansuensis TaxID=258050 RepID=A0A7W7SHS3_9ACTN|nr:hypothetical protein [Kitasatospora gansuensis]MBB4950694.1 hypothetical protein [Kitasatospora gansuensis]